MTEQEIQTESVRAKPYRVLRACHDLCHSFPLQKKSPAHLCLSDRNGLVFISAQAAGLITIVQLLDRLLVPLSDSLQFGLFVP